MPANRSMVRSTSLLNRSTWGLRIAWLHLELSAKHAVLPANLAELPGGDADRGRKSHRVHALQAVCDVPEIAGHRFALTTHAHLPAVACGATSATPLAT